MPIKKWALRSILVASALAIIPASAKQAVPEPDRTVESVITMQVEGSVSFDILGQVESYQIDTKLMEPLRVALDKSVRSWKFKPVQVAGVPRRAVTRMRVTLAAKEVAGGLQVKVDNVVFPAQKGAPVTTVDGDAEQISAGRLRPPGYPVSLMKSGVGGAVLLAIRVGPDGNAAEVVAVQSMLFDVRGRPDLLHKAIGLLEQSATEAAKHWTFKVPETGKPRSADDMTVTIPVEYTVSRATFPAGQWRSVVRLPKREIGWLTSPSGKQSVGVADAVAGELIPLSSTIALATDVVGSDLL